VRVAECDNIRRWRRDMRSLPGVRDTFDLDNAAKGYHTQLFPLNPSGITPILPRWQLEET
jgi:glutathionyl-hydroquinone reductase